MKRFAISVSTAAIAMLIATAASAADYQATPRHHLKASSHTTISPACAGAQGLELAQCECQQTQIRLNTTCTLSKGPSRFSKPTCHCI